MDDQPTLPSSYRSFVACGEYDEPYAPAFKKLLVTEVDTHTHTHAAGKVDFAGPSSWG